MQSLWFIRFNLIHAPVLINAPACRTVKYDENEIHIPTQGYVRSIIPREFIVYTKTKQIFNIFFPISFTTYRHFTKDNK